MALSEKSQEYETKSLEYAQLARGSVNTSSMHADGTYAQLSTTFAILALLHKDDEK